MVPGGVGGGLAQQPLEMEEEEYLSRCLRADQESNFLETVKSDCPGDALPVLVRNAVVRAEP